METSQSSFFKSSSAWKEIQEGYIKESGVWKNFYTAFVATGFTTQTSSGTATVPDGANAIHVQAAVGGGSGGVKGADYDKAGGESGGSGGASGGYVSDEVYSVTEGETLTLTIGAAGAASSGSAYNTTAGNGGSTVLSGATTGAIFTLTGGTGGSGVNGGVQGPLRTNNPSVAGTATVNATPLTSGSFREADGTSVTFGTATTLDQGPVGTFNQSGNGVAGVTGSNCSGDDCTISGVMVELLMQEILQVVQVMLQARLIMVQEVRVQEVEAPQVVRVMVRAVLEALAK